MSSLVVSLFLLLWISPLAQGKDYVLPQGLPLLALDCSKASTKVTELPHPESCHLYVAPPEKSVPKTLWLWEEKKAHTTVPVKICRGLTAEKHCDVGFFGGASRYENHKVFAPHKEECLGAKSNFSDDEPQSACVWMHDTHITVDRITEEYDEATLDPRRKTIHLPQIEKDVGIESGFIQARDLIIVWDPSIVTPEELFPYRKLKKVNCHVSNFTQHLSLRITCPEVSQAFFVQPDAYRIPIPTSDRMPGYESLVQTTGGSFISGLNLPGNPDAVKDPYAPAVEWSAISNTETLGASWDVSPGPEEDSTNAHSDSVSSYIMDKTTEIILNHTNEIEKLKCEERNAIIGRVFMTGKISTLELRVLLDDDYIVGWTYDHTIQFMRCKPTRIVMIDSEGKTTPKVTTEDQRVLYFNPWTMTLDRQPLEGSLPDFHNRQLTFLNNTVFFEKTKDIIQMHRHTKSSLFASWTLVAPQLKEGERHLQVKLNNTIIDKIYSSGSSLRNITSSLSWPHIALPVLSVGTSLLLISVVGICALWLASKLFPRKVVTVIKHEGITGHTDGSNTPLRTAIPVAYEDLQ